LLLYFSRSDIQDPEKADQRKSLVTGRPEVVAGGETGPGTGPQPPAGIPPEVVQQPVPDEGPEAPAERLEEQGGLVGGGGNIRLGGSEAGPHAAGETQGERPTRRPRGGKRVANHAPGPESVPAEEGTAAGGEGQPGPAGGVQRPGERGGIPERTEGTQPGGIPGAGNIESQVSELLRSDQTCGFCADQGMYKRIDHGTGKIEIQEHLRSPMVYLDHWALNDLALDGNLRARFVDTMAKKGGTFRLSVFNMIELSKQTDASQVNSILAMMDSMPDCGLINIDPRDVIKKENALISDASLRLNPSAEMDLVAAHVMAQNYPTEWHVSDIIRKVIPELPSTHLSESNAEFLKEMERLLGIGRSDDDHLRTASKRFKRLKDNGPKYQRPTRELFTMALDFVMRNKRMKMTQYSEWTDLFHVIVPVSYCDLVMIDRRWKSFVAQTGFSYPQIAMVFDKRSTNSFFQTIETWGDPALNHLALQITDKP
jgi:hypothetical protein